MLGLKQEEIIAKKVLFFPFERPADESRLSDDLRLAKEQTLIPFYKERLPESDEVEVETATQRATEVSAGGFPVAIDCYCANVKWKKHFYTRREFAFNHTANSASDISPAASPSMRTAASASVAWKR